MEKKSTRPDLQAMMFLACILFLMLAECSVSFAPQFYAQQLHRKMTGGNGILMDHMQRSEYPYNEFLLDVATKSYKTISAHVSISISGLYATLFTWTSAVWLILLHDISVDDLMVLLFKVFNLPIASLYTMAHPISAALILAVMSVHNYLCVWSNIHLLKFFMSCYFTLNKGIILQVHIPVTLLPLKSLKSPGLIFCLFSRNLASANISAKL